MSLVDHNLRAGLRLLTRTLRRYRRILALSIGGALLWMAMVVAVPYLIGLVVDEAVGAGDRSRLGPLVLVLVCCMD